MEALFLAAEIATDPIVEWLSKAGGFGILAFAVVGFLRGWIVPGRAYEQVQQERNRALELVYKQAEVAQRALEAAETRRG